MTENGDNLDQKRAMNPEEEAIVADSGDEFGRAEGELVRLAQAGDVDAYGELMRRYQGRIYGLVYNMTGNAQDAEDLVQEVFVKAFSAIKRFKQKSSFYTWLHRSAVNRTINYLKKRKRREALSLNEIDPAVGVDPVYLDTVARSSPFSDVSLNELQKKLNTALQVLSDKHRAVVVLHDIQGVKHDEIARMLGCSAGTVRSRLFYARQLLQAELAEFCR
jgi:RNA polymerase sigma-70 factor, ECF subfamily